MIDKAQLRVREQGKDVVHMRFGPGGSRVGEDIMCHIITLKREEMVLVGDTSRHSHTLLWFAAILFCASKLFD